MRGLTVSLAVFVLVYVALRIAVAIGWPFAERLTRRISLSVPPNVLYAIQVGPFIAAALVVCSFTIPAFVRFEPRIVEEEFGFPVVLLSAAALALLAAGLYRGWIAYTRTSRLVSEWRANATPLEHQQHLHILKTGPGTPPLVVAGFFRQKLLISSSTAGLLSEEELTRAIAHESAHIRNHDNIKKLMLRVCSFPPAHRLEHKWLAALEMAADENAVNNKREALDLASALVKASRLSVPTAELATNLTTDAGQLLQVRVERLLAWDKASRTLSVKLLRYVSVGLALTVAILTAVSYQTLLFQMHSLAELLMK
jgi:Zn-dependent protease with chaperone function